MRNLHCKVEPYRSYLYKYVQDNRPVISVENGYSIDYALVYLLAKASGLRSKKRRHIMKRARKILHQALELSLAIAKGEAK